jgi:D-alanyl-lipoteichoic acid acyltransferase DltB (MBOAT superfamily)
VCTLPRKIRFMDFSYRVYLLALPEGYLAGIWLSPNQIQYPNFALRIEIHNFAELWTTSANPKFLDLLQRFDVGTTYPILSLPKSVILADDIYNEWTSKKARQAGLTPLYYISKSSPLVLILYFDCSHYARISIGQ